MKKNKIKLSLYDAIIECVAIQQKQQIIENRRVQCMNTILKKYGYTEIDMINEMKNGHFNDVATAMDNGRKKFKNSIEYKQWLIKQKIEKITNDFN